MKITAQVRLNMERGDSSDLGSAWVEIEDCIKFPVKLRVYRDQDGTEKWFVSYPQRRTEGGYAPIVYPHDKELRQEIHNAVSEAMGQSILKGIGNPPIDEVKVTLLSPRDESAPVLLRGVATIKVAGLTIQGIMIKESRKGLFAQMPQHRSGNEYRDTVYGTSSLMQAEIQQAVLEEYSAELERVRKPSKEPEWLPEQNQNPEEQQTSPVVRDPSAPQTASPTNRQSQTEPEPDTSYLRYRYGQAEGIQRFIEAYRAQDLLQMSDILGNTDMDVSLAEFTENHNAVEYQTAYVKAGDYELHVEFFNHYNPIQTVPPGQPIQQKISVGIYEKGHPIGVQTIEHNQSTSLEGAKRNYEDMLQDWLNLTNQSGISFNAIHYRDTRPDNPARENQRPKGPSM